MVALYARRQGICRLELNDLVVYYHVDIRALIHAGFRHKDVQRTCYPCLAVSGCRPTRGVSFR